MNQEILPSIAEWDWSVNELEPVDRCPICDSLERSVLYSAIDDRLFRTPGTWTLYQCKQCKVAYLNPRPTPAAISKAYAAYHTHETDPVPTAENSPKGIAEWLKTALQNGYLNHQYKLKHKPALPFGVWIGSHLDPVQRHRIDGTFRRLRLPPTGGRLLDVGCGNGAFLMQMRRMGWDVVGLDFDAQAVEACKNKGIHALHGALEDAALAEASFDAITLSHVIEHLYAPVATLRHCYTLLKPGGQLYVETPNLASSGHANFREHWRGLEPPRHLILYNPEVLQQLCRQVGLSIDGVYGVVATFFMNQHSMAIRDGRDPYGADGWASISETVMRQWAEAERASVLHPDQADIIAVLARKPA